MRIAFLQDLTVDAHVDLVSPSFLAFERAVHDGIDGADVQVELVQLDTQGDPVKALGFARQIAADGSFVLAVVAPFWQEPAEVASILAQAGVPTFSLSPLSPSPWSPETATAAGPALDGGPQALWRRFVADQQAQAAVMAAQIRESVPGQDGELACLLGDTSTYSLELRAAIEANLPSDMPRVAPPPANAQDAAAQIHEGCSFITWTGSAAGAVDLASALRPDGRTIDLASDASKTVMPLTVSDTFDAAVLAVTCPCADVDVATSEAARQFVNIYQSDNGLAPGVYAVEGWNAGTVASFALRAQVRTRTQMQAFLTGLESFAGVEGTRSFDDAGELLDQSAGVFRASGSRWLPLSA